jgi:hypothetical protein
MALSAVLPLTASETDSAIASGDDCYFSFQLAHELSPVLISYF